MLKEQVYFAGGTFESLYGHYSLQLLCVVSYNPSNIAMSANQWLWFYFLCYFKSLKVSATIDISMDYHLMYLTS